MFLRTTLCLALICCALGVARAQNSASPPSPNDQISADKDSRHSRLHDTLGSPEDEMLVRQKIKADEKDHLDNVERAREAAQLSTEIRDAFLNNKTLGRTEEKKLERLEKITRKIRSEAGGSDASDALDDPPTQIEPALSRLAEVSDKLRKGVENTPRQVISAAVIERANELLELIHFIHNVSR
jgi:hypothetical protein